MYGRPSKPYLLHGLKRELEDWFKCKATSAIFNAVGWPVPDWVKNGENNHYDEILSIFNSAYGEENSGTS